MAHNTITTVDIGSGPQLARMPDRLLPTNLPIWLVSYEDWEIPNARLRFLATRFDIEPTMIKVAGVRLSKKHSATAHKTFKKILESTDKAEYVELFIPNSRVFEIQNLIFRQK